MEGTYDEATQELTMIMTGIDPATNQEVKSKSVDKDTRVFTMFMETPGGGDGWTKMMEVSYKRRPREGRKLEGPKEVRKEVRKLEDEDKM